MYPVYIIVLSPCSNEHACKAAVIRLMGGTRKTKSTSQVKTNTWGSCLLSQIVLHWRNSWASVPVCVSLFTVLCCGHKEPHVDNKGMYSIDSHLTVNKYVVG